MILKAKGALLAHVDLQVTHYHDLVTYIGSIHAYRNGICHTAMHARLSAENDVTTKYTSVTNYVSLAVLKYPYAAFSLSSISVSGVLLPDLSVETTS